MTPSEFLHKLTGRYLWLNIAAMAALLVAVIIGVIVAMNIYTHHGESIAIPDVRKHSYENAVKLLEELGMEVEVTDTGYVKNLPPGTILEQMPAPGTFVKSGRTIYLTINANDSPTLVMPDIIDNSSLREAMAKLQSMGFKVGEPKYVPGEKDWVYAVTVNGKNVSAGTRVSIESTVIIHVGNGQRDAADSIYYMTDMPESSYDEVSNSELEIRQGGDNDDFEIIE